MLLEMTQSEVGKRGGTWEGMTMVVLETKSSLGLDCQNMGQLYTGTSAHRPRTLMLVKRELYISSFYLQTSAIVCISQTMENEQERMMDQRNA